MAAHDLPYVATCSVGYPQDIYEKFLAAKEIRGRGVRYIQILSPCPPGWRIPPKKQSKSGSLLSKQGFGPYMNELMAV